MLVPATKTSLSVAQHWKETGKTRFQEFLYFGCRFCRHRRCLKTETGTSANGSKALILIGLPRHKVSRLGIEGMQALPRAAVVFRGVGADPVAVELGEGSLGEEAGAGRERFNFAELVFEEAVNGLDIALAGVRGRGDARVLGAAEGDRSREAIAGAVGLEFAAALAAVIGLPGPVRPGDAAALEMSLAAGWPSPPANQPSLSTSDHYHISTPQGR